MITILDYGIGNLRSVLHKVNKIDKAIISNKIEDIEKADKIIIPGVGHFKKGMENIEKYKPYLKDKTILGICLGMQLLTKHSEEGNVKGLGFIDAKTRKFQNVKIPHVGWNSIKIQKESPLLNGFKNNHYFYFTHSYYVDYKDSIATTDYGKEVTSIIKKDNYYGVQFHPEKSHKVGMNIIKNFIEKC